MSERLVVRPIFDTSKSARLSTRQYIDLIRQLIELSQFQRDFFWAETLGSLFN